MEKKRLEEIRVEISRLQQRFGENVLDATNAYELAITDDAMLAGLPEATLGVARSRAAERDLEGWILSLDFPTYESVQKYAHDRDLREELHRAYVGRCRDGEHDNRDLIMGILGLRQELAEMLGYADYSDYRLEEAMANSGSRAFDFIEDLRSRTRPYWQRDVEELRSHGRKLGLDPIRPWDVSYVAEGLRRERFDIDDEMLRPYFPLDQVQKGLFRIARGVFGVSVVEAPNEEVWNPDVGFYELRDDDGTLLGSFYTDWFPRKAKRQGAWMTALITGGPRADGFAPHLGCISGNFSPRNGDRPALLTHREVETLFHEFGHLLHHCTSDVPIPSRTGLRTPWDWVELPSQIMENWIWEREAQRLFARHYATGRPLPPDVLDRMIRARRFMGGYGQMRQLGFAYLDLKLHREYARAPDGDVLAYVERHTLPFVPDEGFVGSHVVTTFSHLFSGGYASAYYSYLWSEVLEADAFSRFRKEGIFNRETGMAFRRAILSRGDAEDPDVLFRDFMGRDPDPEALIRRNLGDRPE